tara:strand:- start:1266 stop:2108 length:843 start_codon:yes stop_codon:yes gene_type:complete
MKKILIPIDFNFNNYDAIDYAVNFFKRETCEFYFFNTYSYDVNGLDAIRYLQEDDEWFEKPKTDSFNRLGPVIQKYTIKNRNIKHSFYAISEYANLIEGIKSTIKNLHIDLVLLAGEKIKEAKKCNYSANTKRIIEDVRDCPVIIIPQSVNVQKNPEFVLASSFGVELREEELANWYELVRIAKGSVKIITLCNKSKMTGSQNANQNKVLSQLQKFSKIEVPIDYLETTQDLKKFASDHADSIICLMDRKPGFLRKYGFSQSKISSLGPLKTSPLIALHR